MTSSIRIFPGMSLVPAIVAGGMQCLCGTQAVSVRICICLQEERVSVCICCLTGSSFLFKPAFDCVRDIVCLQSNEYMCDRGDA